TYEELGHAAFGSIGRLAVLLSKAMYSFGCLIAYVVVVRDNFGLAIRRIALHEGAAWLYDDGYLAFLVSVTIMLPLSCPRTMKPLAKFSFISVLSIVFLVLAIVYLYFTCTNPVFDGGDEQSSFYENWIEIKSSLGTFVFTFTCHHTVNLAYESLPSSIRCPKIWKRVSTNSIVMATETSLAIGIFAYMTFGANTPADVLMGYPPDLILANVARILLCLTMVLTFPL
ncbi:amino acid/polyamine transporter, partial [Thalassiosira pseudonana CCMP1335]